MRRLSLEQSFALQRQFANSVRTSPADNPVDEKVAIYRRLIQRGIAGHLETSLGRTRLQLGEVAWQDWVGRFIAEYQCDSPFFQNICEQFVQFLESTNQLELRPEIADLVRFELAFFQVSCQAQARMQTRVAPQQSMPWPIDSHTEILSHSLKLMPSVKLEAFTYDVFDRKSAAATLQPLAQPLFIALYADNQGKVRTKHLSLPSAVLLSHCTGLQTLAAMLEGMLEPLELKHENHDLVQAKALEFVHEHYGVLFYSVDLQRAMI